MSEPKRIRVVIVEDHLVARMGLRTLIDVQDDIEVVAEARTGHEAIEQCQRERPDVVVMDVQLPLLDGIAATQLIMKAQPTCKILMFSSFDSPSDVSRAQAAGARGYVLKAADGDTIVQAIRSVHAGDRFFPGANASVEDPTADGAMTGLSTREIELLNYVVKGLNNREIASATGLTRGTVRIYLSRVFAKLAVTNRTEAATAAFDLGLVKPQWAETNPANSNKTS